VPNNASTLSTSINVTPLISLAAFAVAPVLKDYHDLIVSSLGSEAFVQRPVSASDDDETACHSKPAWLTPPRRRRYSSASVIGETPWMRFLAMASIG
jgi:hypothetical protein